MRRHVPVAVLSSAQTSSGLQRTSSLHARPVGRVVRQLPVSRPASLQVVAMHEPPVVKVC
jgi:hypothetical protein